jgi:hypothetical protein
VGAGEYASKELQQLVSERKCPAYILPTRNLLGRSALQQITTVQYTVQYILYWPPSKGKTYELRLRGYYWPLFHIE